MDRTLNHGCRDRHIRVMAGAKDKRGRDKAAGDFSKGHGPRMPMRMKMNLTQNKGSSRPGSKSRTNYMHKSQMSSTNRIEFVFSQGQSKITTELIKLITQQNSKSQLPTEIAF